MIEKKNQINLNYYLSKIILKKGKLGKVDSLLNEIHLSLIKKTKNNSLLILDQAIKNIMPIFLLNNKKIGKRVIIIPFFILSEYSRKLLGLKWIVESASSKPGNFKLNFINEVLEAFNNKGNVKKKQNDLNFVVLSNRSNLKYRW